MTPVILKLIHYFAGPTFLIKIIKLKCNPTITQKMRKNEENSS
jgi:hypothetical protein